MTYLIGALVLLSIVTIISGQTVPQCTTEEVVAEYGASCQRGVDSPDQFVVCPADGTCATGRKCCTTTMCGTSGNRLCVLEPQVAVPVAPPSEPQPGEDYCGKKPEEKETFAAKIAQAAIPAVDVAVTAQPKSDKLSIDLQCDTTGKLATTATLGDLFSSISTSVNNQVSQQVEAPLDAICLPHVLTVFARPRNVSLFEHPAKFIQGLKMKGMKETKGQKKGPEEMKKMKGLKDKIQCSFEKKAIGDYTFDDELLAVLPLDNAYSIQGNPLSTNLKFVKNGCPLCGEVTVIVRVDPLGLLNDTDTCNNYMAFNATFNCNCDQNKLKLPTKQIFGADPNKSPTLKICNATHGSSAAQAKLTRHGVAWNPVSMNKLTSGDVRVPLAAEILEMLSDTCRYCSNQQPDSCPAESTPPDLSTVDISEWNDLVDIAKEHAKEMSQDDEDASSDDENEIDTTVECVFKTLKLASDTKKCPFRKNKLPPLLRSSYDRCKTREEGDEDDTAEVFEDEQHSMEMDYNDYLGAIVEGLCGDKQKKGAKKTASGDANDAAQPATGETEAEAETEKPQCPGDSMPLSDTSVLGQPSCQVKNLQNLLRENQSIRQKFFSRTIRKALKQMSLNALKQRLIDSLEMVGINDKLTTPSLPSLMTAIENVNAACIPEPNAPSCPRPSKQLSFYDDAEFVHCAMSHPDDEALVCHKEKCAMKACPQCGSKPRQNCTFADLKPAMTLFNVTDKNEQSVLKKMISKPCQTLIKKIMSQKMSQRGQNGARGFQTSRGSGQGGDLMNRMALQYGVDPRVVQEMLNGYAQEMRNGAMGFAGGMVGGGMGGGGGGMGGGMGGGFGNGGGGMGNGGGGMGNGGGGMGNGGGGMGNGGGGMGGTIGGMFRGTGTGTGGTGGSGGRSGEGNGMGSQTRGVADTMRNAQDAEDLLRLLGVNPNLGGAAQNNVNQQSGMAARAGSNDQSAVQQAFQQIASGSNSFGNVFGKKR